MVSSPVVGVSVSRRGFFVLLLQEDKRRKMENRKLSDNIKEIELRNPDFFSGQKMVSFDELTMTSGKTFQVSKTWKVWGAQTSFLFFPFRKWSALRMTNGARRVLWKW